jgi:hypothetical protein
MIMAEIVESQIMEELKAIRKDIGFIKEHIEDVFLTADDEAALEEAEKEYAEGKSVSLDEFDKASLHTNILKTHN